MERIKSRAELMRRLQPGVKLKIITARMNGDAVGRVKTIRNVQTQDMVCEPSGDSQRRTWQAIPPPGALRFTEKGFEIYDYGRKDDRYTVIPDGKLLIAYEFIEEPAS